MLLKDVKNISSLMMKILQYTFHITILSSIGLYLTSEGNHLIEWLAIGTIVLSIMNIILEKRNKDQK